MGFEPGGDAVEGVEAEGFADGFAEVGVGVHVVEDAAGGGFEILDAADIEAAGSDEALTGGDGFGGDFGIGIELDRLDGSGGGNVAVAGFAGGGIAGFRRTEVEGAVGNDAHGVEELAAEKLHADDAAGGIGGEVFLKEEEMIGLPDAGLGTEEGEEFGGGLEQEHACAAAALFGFEEGGPTGIPEVEGSFGVVEGEGSRVVDAELKHESGLGALAEFKGEGAGAVEDLGAADFEAADEG